MFQVSASSSWFFSSACPGWESNGIRVTGCLQARRPPSHPDALKITQSTDHSQWPGSILSSSAAGLLMEGTLLMPVPWTKHGRDEKRTYLVYRRFLESRFHGKTTTEATSWSSDRQQRWQQTGTSWRLFHQMSCRRRHDVPVCCHLCCWSLDQLVASVVADVLYRHRLLRCRHDIPLRHNEHGCWTSSWLPWWCSCRGIMLAITVVSDTRRQMLSRSRVRLGLWSRTWSHTVHCTAAASWFSGCQQWRRWSCQSWWHRCDISLQRHFWKRLSGKVTFQETSVSRIYVCIIFFCFMQTSVVKWVLCVVL